MRNKIIMLQKKWEHDTRDYYQEFVDYSNKLFNGQDDYEQRFKVIALDFCKSVDIHLFEDPDTGLIFDATLNFNGEYKQ